jgi:hypothetical protein
MPILAEQVDYLGYIMGNDKIQADEDRISAIQSWSVPKTVTKLRSFLDLTNTLLSIVPMYAEHAT